MAGLAIGCSLGDVFIRLNGKKPLNVLVFKTILIQILGNGLKLVMNFPCVLIGRVIFGLTNGVLMVVMGKIVTGSIPNEVM